MKEEVAALDESSPLFVRLEWLSLIGLDLSVFASSSMKPFIDFESLSTLTLESCPLLEAIFPLLTAGRRKTKSALRLQRLAVRHEDTTHAFLRELENFLVSLKPQSHLRVLLGTANSREVFTISYMG